MGFRCLGFRVSVCRGWRVWGLGWFRVWGGLGGLGLRSLGFNWVGVSGFSGFLQGVPEG